MTHQEALDLLPWYAAETLSDEERHAVSEHLEACPECAMELAQFQELRRADVELSRDIPPAPANMLQQALAEIDDYEQERGAASRPHPAARSWWEAFWNPEPGFARLVMAAQFALVIALAVGLIRSNEPDYGVFSGPGEGTTISIQFADTATAAQMRDLLADIQGVIVDGPSAIGLYTVRVPLEPEDAGALNALVQRLQSQADIVQFAARGP
jgi:hypothetical protein